MYASSSPSRCDISGCVGVHFLSSNHNYRDHCMSGNAEEAKSKEFDDYHSFTWSYLWWCHWDLSAKRDCWTDKQQCLQKCQQINLEDKCFSVACKQCSLITLQTVVCLVFPKKLFAVDIYSCESWVAYFWRLNWCLFKTKTLLNAWNTVIELKINKRITVALELSELSKYRQQYSSQYCKLSLLLYTSL